MADDGQGVAEAGVCKDAVRLVQSAQRPCSQSSGSAQVRGNPVRTSRLANKGIRQDKWLTLYVSKGSQHFGKLGFEIVAGQLIRRKGKVEISRDSFDTMLTCYCSLMAFMVYEKPELVESDEPPAAERKNHRPKSRPAKKQTTYILRRRTAATRGAQGGHHASPKGVFTVRGHYRKYRSGKTVWIAEYKKGTGEKKSKTYKMGGGTSGEVLSR